MQGKSAPQRQQYTLHVNVAHSNKYQVLTLQDGQSTQQTKSRQAMDIVTCEGSVWYVQVIVNKDS